MYKYLNVLQHKRLFHKRDVVDVTGNVRKAEMVLLSYQKYKLICKIRRDLYCITSIATGLPDVSKFEVASAISPSGCIAYHAALEYHGLVHQAWNEVCVISKTFFSDFEFDGVSYTCCPQKFDVGIIEPMFERGVRVTSLERTVVDCIVRIDLAGGFEEVMHCFESLSFLDEKKMLEVLSAYNTPVVWKKTGYVLECLQKQTGLSEPFFLQCHSKMGKSVNFLTNRDDCTLYIKTWQLYVPEQNIQSVNEII